MDFMHPPRIFECLPSRHCGFAGTVLSICVEDILEEFTVTVQLVTPSGVVAEEGPAVILPGVLEYGYVVRDVPLLKPGITVRAIARDLPGNVTEQDFNRLSF